MDTNTNREQTNQFIKGMNTDTSDSLIDDQQYRYAENVRIITNKDNNSGEIRLIEGNKVITFDQQIEGEILAFDSIRHIGTLITKKDNEWSIYLIDFKENKLHLLFGPCIEPIWEEDQTGKNISTVLRWESEDNIHLYIADGIHNILDVQFKEDFTNLSLGSNFNNIFGYQQAILDKPSVEIINVHGQIEGPVVQYAYRFYRENGSSTQISPLSEQVVLYKNDKQGFAPNKKTTKSTAITIKRLVNNTFLNKLELYRITYIQLGQLPKVELIYDTQLDDTNNDVVLYDYGNTGLTEISSSEFLSTYSLQITPKVLESKGDYLFAGNIKYSQDQVDETLEDFDVRAFSLGSGIDFAQNPVQWPTITQQFSSYNIFVNGYTYDSQDWGTINSTQYNGIGPHIAWKYVYEQRPIYYCTNEYKTPVYNKTYINFNNNVTDDVTKNKPGKSYRPGEIYRFGIRLFNNKGIASSVKWIADIQIPTDSQIGLKPVDNNYVVYSNIVSIQFDILNYQDWQEAGISAYEIVQCQRNISDKFILSEGIVGKVNEVQYVHKAGDSFTYQTTDFLTPVGFLSLENIYACTADYDNYNGIYKYSAIDSTGRNAVKISKPNNNIIQFASPEYVYQSDDIKDIIKERKDLIYLNINQLYIPYSERVKVNNPFEYTGSYTTWEDTVQPIYDLEPENLNTSSSDWNASKWKTIFDGTVSFVQSSRDNESTILPYDLGVIFPYTEECVICNHTTVENTLYSTPSYVINPATYIYNFGPRKQHDDIPYELSTYNSGANDGLYLGINYTNHTTSNNINNDNTPRVYYPFRTHSHETYSVVNDAPIRHFFNHIYPQSISINQNKNINLTVKDIAYTESPNYSDYADGDNVTIRDNVTSIGGKSFINWSAPFIVAETDTQFISDRNGRTINTHNKPIIPNSNEDIDVAIPSMMSVLYPIGAGGKSILFQVNENIDIDPKYADNTEWVDAATGEQQWTRLPYICTAQIKQSVIPYGGYNQASIKNSLYNSVNGYGIIGTDNSVEIAGGDTYIQMFTYNALHEWYDQKYTRFYKMATVYTVPIQTDIDIHGQYSDSLFGVTTNDYRVQDKASSFAGYTQTDDAYLYNTAYHVVSDVFKWSSDTRTEGQSNSYDTRVHYSNVKTNNEKINSWTQFKTANFIDVDTRFGEITALQLFKDKLIFWQNNAVGLLSVNERSVVQDVNSTNLVLGSGGVLDRYDYFSTIYGQKSNQHNQVCSDGSLYWWDENNNEIMGYAEGSSIAPLSSLKQIKNQINAKTNGSTLPTLFYDPKTKEVICNINDSNGSIVYNEQIQAFTSIYKYNPEWYCNVDGQIYTATSLKTTVKEIIEGVDTDVVKHYIKVFKEDQHTTDTVEEIDYNNAYLYGSAVYPKLKYVVNVNNRYNKVYDIQTFGGRFYGGDNLSSIKFEYDTPLKQHSQTDGSSTTNREYDFRLNIPRAGYDDHGTWKVSDWGDRMRGKTMQCVIRSSSNNLDFALQYITTKYRISWT